MKTHHFFKHRPRLIWGILIILFVFFLLAIAAARFNWRNEPIFHELPRFIASPAEQSAEKPESP